MLLSSLSYKGVFSMPTPVEQWVEECARLTHPKDIHWCDGSEAEYQHMIHDMLETGTLIELNQKEYPGCYLHRSDPTDVARTEHLTYVCTLERFLAVLCRAVPCTWCPTSWGRSPLRIAKLAWKSLIVPMSPSVCVS